MRTIFLSFLMGTLFVFTGDIYGEDIKPFTDEDLQKYNSKSLPTTEKMDDFKTFPRNDNKLMSNETPKNEENKSSRDITEAEKDIIASRCRQIWNRYRTALSKGDIEGALKNVSENSNESFRNALQSQETTTDLGDIGTGEDIRNNIARFKMFAQVKLRPNDSVVPGYSVGDFIEIESYVVFTRDPAGEWKIDFY